MKSSMIDSYIRTPESQTYIDHDVTWEFTFKNASGISMFEITITPDDLK